MAGYGPRLVSESGRLADFNLERASRAGRWRLAFFCDADAVGDVRGGKLDSRNGVAVMALRAMDVDSSEAAMERLRSMARWPRRPEDIAVAVGLSLRGVPTGILSASVGNGSDNLRLLGLPEAAPFARAWT